MAINIKNKKQKEKRNECAVRDFLVFFMLVFLPIYNLQSLFNTIVSKGTNFYDFLKKFLDKSEEVAYNEFVNTESLPRGGKTMSESEALVCCFTGHRTIRTEHMRALPDVLDRVLEGLIGHNITVFRTGGAIGFDTIAALKVLEKKEKYPAVRLELVLPCQDQTKGWNKSNRWAYEYVRSQADEVICLHEEYVSGCMLERNRKLVQGSHCCVGYCTEQKGGSAYTLRYANQKGLRVINLAPLIDVELKNGGNCHEI